MGTSGVGQLFDVLDSQLFWGVVTLILAAFAFSGKLSMGASVVFLVLAWLVGCIGIYRSHVIEDWFTLVASCLFLGTLLAILAAWIQPLPITAKQEESALNLDIAISHVVRMRSGIFKPIERDGWIVYLPDVRFTNRSKTDKVSLGLRLKVRLRNSPRKEEYLDLRTDGLKAFQPALPPQQQYLFDPINIEPQDTVTGNLGFLILPQVEISAGGSDTIDHNNSLLEITDYVSGKTMTIVASKFNWETMKDNQPKPDPTRTQQSTTTINQGGTITGGSSNTITNTYNNNVTNFITLTPEAKPNLELKQPLIANKKVEKGYESAVKFTLTTPYPVGNLYVAVHGKSIQEVSIGPMRTGVFMVGHSGKREGYAFTNIPNAYGDLQLTIISTEPLGPTNRAEIESRIE